MTAAKKQRASAGGLTRNELRELIEALGVFAREPLPADASPEELDADKAARDAARDKLAAYFDALVALSALRKAARSTLARVRRQANQLRHGPRDAVVENIKRAARNTLAPTNKKGT